MKATTFRSGVGGEDGEGGSFALDGEMPPPAVAERASPPPSVPPPPSPPAPPKSPAPSDAAVAARTLRLRRWFPPARPRAARLADPPPEMRSAAHDCRRARDATERRPTPRQGTSCAARGPPPRGDHDDDNANCDDVLARDEDPACAATERGGDAEAATLSIVRSRV